MLSKSKTAQNGFTLIEVMIVVAIIAILATVSYSSYRNTIVRSNRAAAASYLLEVANLQERFFLDNRAYATSMAQLGATPPDEVDDNYEVTIDNPGGNTTYRITATPEGAQDSDDTDCGWLRINNESLKETEFGGDRCWR